MMHNVTKCLIRPAVQYAEFWDALHSIFPGPKRPGDSTKEKIGIAVSGGLDSMALARLCMGPRINEMRSVDFHAFIVDHRARTGSAEEAKLVASRLRGFGLDSTILTLQWPIDVKAAKLLNFETQARRLRYQALGQACRDKKIWSLLTAHHDDDQAETLLLRLGKGQRGWRMKGMRSSAEIPECWGLHGVHQSGLQMLNPLSKVVHCNENSHNDQEVPQTSLDHQKKKTRPTIDIEDGGIKIYRPLLGFSKNQLRATCVDRRIVWVEDETNQDTTRTPRNAIRQLLGSGRLPKALRKSSILAAAKRVEEDTLERISDAEKWFRRTQILVFDVRSGVLVVRVRARAMPIKFSSEPYSRRESERFKLIASLLLRRLVEFVSPKETISLQQLEFVVNSIFPDLDNPEATALDKRLQPSKFTAGGVQLERLDSSIGKYYVNEIERSKEHLDPDFVWLLTRQSGHHASALLIPAPSPFDRTVGPETPSPPPSLCFSSWHLFDGRYWIRLSHTSPHPLEIRLLRPTNMDTLHKAFSDVDFQRHHYKWRLKSAAPGNIRFTLPMIAEAGEDGKMLAIPTLGIIMPGVQREMGLKWEMRYKKVDWGAQGVRGRDLQLRMGKGIVREKNIMATRGTGGEKPSARKHGEEQKDIQEKSVSGEERMLESRT